MKKQLLVTTAIAMIFLASCSSDNTTETATDTTAATEEQNHGHGHDHEQHEGMAHREDAYAAGVVVETPDFSSVAAPFKRNVEQMLEQYLQLKDALIASDADAAKKAAMEVAASAEALPVATLMAPGQKKFAEEQQEKISDKATSIANAGNIDMQREHLKELSLAVYALTKAYGATNKKLYYQHCPMALNNKGGSWLSTSKEIHNPYYGEKMLKCGSNVEELN